jgi:lysozyme
MDPDDLANLTALIAAGRGQPAPPSVPSETDRLADALLVYGQPRPPIPVDDQRRQHLAWALMNYRPKGSGAPVTGPAPDQPVTSSAPALSPQSYGDVDLASAPIGSRVPGAPYGGQMIQAADTRPLSWPADRFLPTQGPDTDRYWRGPSSPEQSLDLSGFSPNAFGAGDLPQNMTVSDKGAAFIRSWEQGPGGGPAEKPYPSLEGGAPTGGVGHKYQRGEPVPAVLTADQIDRQYQSDLRRQQDFVRNNVRVPLTQNQFDALTSLAFTSPRAFGPDSELLKALNAGDYAGAAQQFNRWNTVPHNGGRIVERGLTNRRGAEQDMFLQGLYSDHQ